MKNQEEKSFISKIFQALLISVIVSGIVYIIKRLLDPNDTLKDEIVHKAEDIKAEVKDAV
ncbi:MAG TPA: hypothetical protein VLZ75_14560 [Chitinophagales bacterium]|nr:hypothetical protein [Chitinophagales bacterium]